ncbi:unnamed protein product [Oppiella nova]|uniref:Uncharacterized protein n=1 Tax=Oppiella nova TaxID=334625 RepID=A0A7R9LQH7_9ACAR|nr:unnamed protein product [Oppiella nova]CAG2165357.1 unnamed protein product [Oppiella nova]
MKKYFLTLSLFVNVCLAAKSKCNMTIEEADVCAKKLMFIGDRDNIIPTNDQQMQTYCSRMQEGIRCIRHYARSCLPPFPQQVFGMFAYDSKTVLRKQCKLPNDRSEFVRHVSCFLPKPAMEPLHLCMDQFIISLNVVKSMDPDIKIPGVCCTNDVLDFTCGRYESVEKCDKYMDANAWSQLKDNKSAEQLVTERALQKYFSPIPSLVAVITNYEMR